MVWPEVALNWLFPYPLCVSVLGVPSLCLFVALPSQTDLGATPPCAGDRAVSEGDQVRCHPGRVGGDHGGLGDSASHEELPQKRRVQTVGSREAPNLHTSIYIPCWQPRGTHRAAQAAVDARVAVRDGRGVSDLRRPRHHAHRHGAGVLSSPRSPPLSSDCSALWSDGPEVALNWLFSYAI